MRLSSAGATRGLARCVLKVQGWRIHNLSTQPGPGSIQQKIKNSKIKRKKGFWCVFIRAERICCAVLQSVLLLGDPGCPHRDLSTSTSPGAFSQPLLTPKVLLQSLCSKSTGCAPHLDPTLQTWLSTQEQVGLQRMNLTCLI